MDEIETEWREHGVDDPSLLPDVDELNPVDASRLRFVHGFLRGQADQTLQVQLREWLFVKLHIMILAAESTPQHGSGPDGMLLAHGRRTRDGGGAMKIPRSAVLVLVSLVAGAILAAGVTAAVTAGASGTSSTYFACLRSGTLTRVGVTRPACPNGATVISWNSVGPRGPQGLRGAKGAQGPVGPQGPGAQSAYAPAVAAPQGGDMATVTLSLAQGDYLVTWDIGVAMPNYGSCYDAEGPNVTELTSALSSDLVSVGHGGSTLTVDCSGNSIGDAVVTATPTSAQ